MIYLNYTGDRYKDAEDHLKLLFINHDVKCWDDGVVVGRDYNKISAMIVYVPEKNIEEPEEDNYIAMIGRGCCQGIREASNKGIPTFFYDSIGERFIDFDYRDVDIIDKHNWQNHGLINYDIYTENDVSTQHIRNLNIGYDKEHKNKLIDCDGIIARVGSHSKDKVLVAGVNGENYSLERHAKKSEKIYASKEQMLELIKHNCLQIQSKDSDTWSQYRNSDKQLLNSVYNDNKNFRVLIQNVYTEIQINTGNSLTTMRKTHKVTEEQHQDVYFVLSSAVSEGIPKSVCNTFVKLKRVSEGYTITDYKGYDWSISKDKVAKSFNKSMYICHTAKANGLTLDFNTKKEINKLFYKGIDITMFFGGEGYFPNENNNGESTAEECTNNKTQKDGRKSSIHNKDSDERKGSVVKSKKKRSTRFKQGIRRGTSRTSS